MNLEPIIQSEVSQKKKNKYINAYIWNLERQNWWTFLQGNKWDTHIKNNLVDTVGEEEGGTNGNSSIETYILSYVK